MKIAIMGIRGIPAKYGGFETFAEQLAPRLVNKGHQVVVYGRSNIIEYKDEYYKGVKLIILPTISHKYLDTPIHTLLSVIHSSICQYDIVLICNAANSIFSFVPRLTGKKVVVNVDGIERRRKKWNWLGKLWYLMGEIFSCVFPNEIVTDAKMIEKYYLERYKKKSSVISYGFDSVKTRNNDSLSKYDVLPNEYVLSVARFEPENNIHLIINAFKNIKTNKKLVLIGDAPYASEYKKNVLELANDDKRIIFTGYMFGIPCREFQSNAYCYVHAGEVGGTPPALVEAMGCGNCVIVNGTPENIEVVENAGLIYKKNDLGDLTDKLQYIIDNPNIVKSYAEKARERIEQNYSWDKITDKYEKLFQSLCKT